MPSGDPLIINDLLRYIANYPEKPSRTVALEQAIQIGTGFHGKWYRSQKEHCKRPANPTYAQQISSVD